MQFAARQHGFQQVAGVHGAFGFARAHHGVQLVDEQNDLAFGRLHFFQDGFESLFEFAPKFRAGDERAHVERDHALVLQSLRHVAADDALGQTFHNGGFADARLANEYRIIFGAPGEHLDHAADFFIAPDDGIQLAFRGGTGSDPGRTSRALHRWLPGFGAGDALASAHLLQGAHQTFAGDAKLVEQLAGCAVSSVAASRTCSTEVYSSFRRLASPRLG